MKRCVQICAVMFISMVSVVTTSVSQTAGSNGKIVSRARYAPNKPVKNISGAVTGILFPDTVYRITSNITVSPPGVLTILPGTILKFTPNTSLTVNGTLRAVGTTDSLIIFTSEKDDSYGGDSNGDSDLSYPLPGDWQNIQLQGSADSSRFEFCQFFYGGLGGNGMLSINAQTMKLPQKNLTFKYSGSMGIRGYGFTAIFDSIRADSNLSYGIYISGYTPVADVTIRNSTFRWNTFDGLSAVDNSMFREITNSIISNNGRNGVVVENGSLPQTYRNNIVEYNSLDGFQINSSTLDTNTIQFIENRVQYQGGIGILSSAARLVDNVIKWNTYPLGVWGRLGNSYLDSTYNDGNIIEQNIVNNVIALRNKSLKGVLTNSFPRAMGSLHAYLVIENIFLFGGDTLTIHPGSTMKFWKSPAGVALSFTIDGTLIAEGTKTAPIVFTSWRDNSAGGHTNGTDSLASQPGDWGNIYFNYSAEKSRIRYCEFRYGGGNYGGQIYCSLPTAPVLFSNIKSQYSNTYGIEISYSNLTMDSSEFSYNNNDGVYSYGGNENSLRLRRCTITHNAGNGVKVPGGVKLYEISYSAISENGMNGIFVDQNSAPALITNNTICSNSNNGIYFTALNDNIDTLILFANNVISNNTNVGLISSRAYILNDSLYGNRIPILLTGQVSLEGTGNALGNVYFGNVISGNMYDNVIAAQGFIEGKLGSSFPATMISPVLFVVNDLYIDSDKEVEIVPGTIVKIRTADNEAVSGIYVVGTLIANGEKNKKIIFTSFHDDDYGGDSNNDSSGTAPAPGDWDAISFVYSRYSILRNVIIKYGSYENTGELIISSSSVTVDSSVVSYSNNSGILIFNSSVSITSSDIHHNKNGISFFQYPDESLAAKKNIAATIIQYGASRSLSINDYPSQIAYCNIFQNSLYGLEFDIYSMDTLDARNNYWGDPSGPLVLTGDILNPQGKGDEINITGSGVVLYEPFLSSSSSYLYGDVSGNGLITAYDASLVLQNFIGERSFTPIQSIVADVTGDSTISPLDASYILRYVVGIINEFPALGKLSMETQSASAFDFSLVPGTKAGEFELTIRLNKPSSIYGIGFKLSYDTTYISPISVAKGANTDSMVLAYYFPKGEANVALAGTAPLNNEGEIAKFSFVLKDAAKGKETIPFTVNKFILNETDVTDETPKIILNVRNVFPVPATFALEQNFPNPFNPATTIQYQLPKTSAVTITVYNILGQEIKRLVHEVQTPGFYSVTWNGMDESSSRAASGMYLYRIQAESSGNEPFVKVKKMLFLK
ncbi:MAG: right-handed parallel beta-helix repeat-containing protein [Bacteroidetes bacterium]|nr:right-handed parallel beta-helix repeat-containing protein [Bacteroidota bacterium]